VVAAWALEQAEVCMMIRGSLGAIVVCAIAIAPAAVAADRYEGAGTPFSDDSNLTPNILSHGDVQEHDLDEAGGGDDVDWMAVPTIARHSYEARIANSAVATWAHTSTSCPSCAQFERVNSAGTVLASSTSFTGTSDGYRTVRWTATATGVGVDFIRTRGDAFVTENANSTYTLRFWDTTYSIPRWNNASGQVTVFLIQNVTPLSVTGNIDFYSTAGALLATQPFTLAPNSLFSVNTGTLGALAGQAGHAFVSHNGGYGGLAGKAVALEPATGFSFDTIMNPLPN
jgi:hypothetical protein